MIDIPVIETERLSLRAMREGDLDAYAALLADAEVMEFMGGPADREEAWHSIAFLLGHWALRGYGIWALEERASGVFVGRAGLLRPENRPATEIAWMLARPYWGRGYATEAAKAAKAWAGKAFPAEPLVSLVAPDNTRSIALARRLSAREDGTYLLHGKETLIFRHSRP